ncbi:MAG TPA: hypothetical protein DCS20_00325 [Candidatus Yonathbacteria bacterium]|nr:hypothetical protein [Candidatus Yonathbacteria bacterium]
MNKKYRGEYTRGFTLIELLVVISIMGLLSSVVLSSVQSARKKADDTQRNQIVGEYVKALQLAYDAAGTGQYPATGNTAYWCLGDYTPTGSGNYDTGSICRYAFPFINFSENATVLNALAPYLPSLPTLKLVDVGSGIAYQGSFYMCRNAGNCSTAKIEWYLDRPNQKCIRGAAYENSGTGTKCTLTLN